MQDGANQFSLSVRAWLNNDFTGWWIGRGGPKEWLLYSFDLIACNLFS
jgi:hypothetical protein